MESIKHPEKPEGQERKKRPTGFPEMLNRWIAGIIAGLIILILIAFGRVRIKGLNFLDVIKSLRKKKKEKSDSKEAEEDRQGLVIILNHPSMTETFITPGLFSFLFIFSRRFLPMSTPDSHFFDAGWFAPFRFSCIPIVRDESKARSREALMAAVEMRDWLKAGGILIVFAEGGRTYKGNEEEMIVSEKGNRIRPFKRGLESVIRKSGAKIMCGWTVGGDRIIKNVPYEGERRRMPFPKFWNVIRIRFGKIFSFSELDPKDPMGDLEKCVLGLGDSFRTRSK